MKIKYWVVEEQGVQRQKDIIHANIFTELLLIQIILKIKKISPGTSNNTLQGEEKIS